MAVSDTFAQAGKRVAEKYGCKFFASGEELINDKEIDALIVTTADAYHAQYVKAAIVAKKFTASRNPTVRESYDTPMAVENSMIHEIDVLRWLFGEDYVAAKVVFPKKTRHAHKNLQYPQVMRLWTKSGVHRR